MHHKASLKLPKVLARTPVFVLIVWFLFSICMYVVNMTGEYLRVPVVKEYGNYVLGFFLFLSIPGMIAGFFLKDFRKNYNKELESIDPAILVGDNSVAKYGDSMKDIAKLGIDALLGPISSRISIGEYIQGSIILYLVHVVFFGFTILITMSVGSIGTSTMFIINLVAIALIIIGGIRLSVRRFNDLDKKRTHIFYLLIPIYNIYITAMLRLKTGTIGSNTYGKDPLFHQPSTNAWYRGNSFIILLLILALYLGLGSKYTDFNVDININKGNDIEAVEIQRDIKEDIVGIENQQNILPNESPKEDEELDKTIDKKNDGMDKSIDEKLDDVYAQYCTGKNISLGLQDHKSMRFRDVETYIKTLVEEDNIEGASYIIQNLIEDGTVDEEYFDSFYDDLEELTYTLASETDTYSTVEELLERLMGNNTTTRENMFLLGNVGVKAMVEGNFDIAKKYLECSATFYGHPRSMYLLATIYRDGSEGMKKTFSDLNVEKNIPIDSSKSLFWAANVLAVDGVQKVLGAGSSPQRNSIGMMDRYTQNPGSYGINLDETNTLIGEFMEKRYGTNNDTTNKNTETREEELEKKSEDADDTDSEDAKIISIAKEKTLRFIELYNDDADIITISDEMILSKDGAERKSLETIWLPSIQKKKKDNVTDIEFVGYTKKLRGKSVFYTLYTQTNPFGTYSSINGIYLSIVVHPSSIKFNGISTTTKTTLQNLLDGKNVDFIEFLDR